MSLCFIKIKIFFFRTSGEDKSVSLCFIKTKSVSLCFIKIKSFFRTSGEDKNAGMK